MDTIDHRILVHASPQVVWNYISNIENNPYWQVNCRDITFLTSAHSGQGVRWRQKPENGGEQVMEITAWYNQLGYEYIIVDGSSFARNQGRIRLQEIAEGTIVQWTFNYELGGLLGGLRNALIARRNIENAMIDSLWTLWRHLSNSEDPDFQSRTLMRDAPDVEARARYEPRHPTITKADHLPINNSPIINEPPIDQDDTRPRPAVSPPVDPEPAPAPMASNEENYAEPDFLSGMSTAEMEQTIMPDDPFSVPDSSDDSIFAPPPTPTSPEPKPVVIDSQPPQESQPIEQTPESTPTPIIEPKFDVEDTSQISVFDLFGVTKPSETQEIQPVKIPDSVESTETDTSDKAKPVAQQETHIPSPTQPIPKRVIVTSGKRTGKRYLLRQATIKVRRPE